MRHKARHKARQMKTGFLGKINAFLKATSYCAKHITADYKEGRWKSALYILKLVFILLWGKTCLQALHSRICNQMPSLSDLPGSKSKTSGPLASSYLPFGRTVSPALPVAAPQDASLWGLQFNLNFGVFLNIIVPWSPKFQDKTRLSRTHFFLLKCLQCFEETLEIISVMAKGAYLLPAVIFLCEYRFVRGILFLYLDSGGFFFLNFLTVHA